MEDEYGNYEQQDPEEVAAPAPAPVGKSWSWSTDMLLWGAGGVLALGFGIWFLMSYTGARAKALAEQAAANVQS